MAGYQPLKITGYSTGLVQEREEFLLPDDAYPTLQNAYVWRERILRKKGYELLGRLQRNFLNQSIGNFSAAGAGTFTFDLFALLGITDPAAALAPKTIVLTIAGTVNQVLTDSLGTGAMTITTVLTPITTATINYRTGILTIVTDGAFAASATTLTGGYYPNLPVMGI